MTQNATNIFERIFKVTIVLVPWKIVEFSKKKKSDDGLVKLSEMAFVKLMISMSIN